MVVEKETIVIYDVVSQKVRNRVVDVCKDYGLERFQYSAFRGRLSRNKAEELWERVLEVVEGCIVRILMVQLCEEDARGLRSFEYGGEEE